MGDKLHRQTKQQDAEALAAVLQTCCAYSNSALVEDGTHLGSNEYFYRVVEQYLQIDDATPDDLENVAGILETLASQFREAALNIRNEQGS
jgi:hypothetical protein